MLEVNPTQQLSNQIQIELFSMIFSVKTNLT